MTMTPQRCEKYLQMMQFLLDCIHPEQYGHAIPQEVRERAARILKLAPAEVTSIEHSPEPTP